MAGQQIVLVGLSGVGKTTVGRALAERLGWPFLDTDDMVTAAEGSTPAQLIDSGGEPAFRKIEERVVAEASQRTPAVISTGGGAFLSARNRAALGERGFICYLDATPTAIAARLRAGSEGERRPLLDDDPAGLEARLAQLDRERRRFYSHADIWVPVQPFGDADTKVLDVAVNRILRAWAIDGDRLAALPRRLERLGSDAPAVGPAAVVDTGCERYPIWVGAGELDRLPDRLEQLELTGRRVFLISDSEVIDKYGRRAAEALDAGGIAGTSYVVPAGEQSKQLQVAREIYGWLAEQRAERRDLVIALGGGVVCDLAGFVAATYLRGMPFLQIPTTVLAMNDAAIGGKVAVDLPDGKNLVGAFHQPRGVVADVSTLRTLPGRAFAEGFAEVIKHAWILDPELLAELEARPDSYQPHSEVELLVDVTARSARLKALIVSSDPEERGLRAILNYGHTIGHAIEATTGFSEFLHGEAVAIGMMGAARIAHGLGLIDEELVARHGDVLRGFGLPTASSSIDVERVLGAMMLDKKVEQGRLHFVLLEGVGKPVVRSDVPETLVRSVLRDLARG
ncbi:MAG: 3-dehydroquinate synthase [Chloroflexi bacterium]|nr:3-dehydroquinate synthase [Chloroflexota bacterium]MDA1146490.1 3-dehydroquinate synthase [Chloroflexota bacterium]